MISGEMIQLQGADPVFLDLMDRVSQVAPLERPVLVIGERGTGKELIAARLHFLSGRWGRPFVKLNCAALPETLIEAELFGVEPGAFTGATRRRPGRFEQADTGTLFLDEIATLSPAAQEKLLRIVEYGEFERLGGTETLEIDVRVIGATNRDLPAMAARDAFRADLLDRLSFDVLTVPPLRARHEDILLLAEHFGRAMAHELGWTAFPGFAPEAIAALQRYDWPGNVRELKNVAERAVYRWAAPDHPVAAIELDPFDSPYRPRETATTDQAQPDLSTPHASGEVERHAQGLTLPEPPYDFRSFIDGVEKHLLANALAAHRYNQRTTAKALSLTYDQLRHAARKHGLL